MWSSILKLRRQCSTFKLIHWTSSIGSCICVWLDIYYCVVCRLDFTLLGLNDGSDVLDDDWKWTNLLETLSKNLICFRFPHFYAGKHGLEHLESRQGQIFACLLLYFAQFHRFMANACVSSMLTPDKLPYE
jgi:hypothetical protein